MVLVLSEEHKVHLSFLTQVDVEGTCGIQWLHAAMLISGVGVASRLALNFLPPSPLSPSLCSTVVVLQDFYRVH